MANFAYLALNIGTIFIPFIASFYKPQAFYKVWKYFFGANFLVAIPFVLWDIQFTRMGIWGFNSDYFLGTHILNLPLEEVMFFACIPYACTFTYFALKYLLPETKFSKYQHFFKYLFLAISVSFILFGYQQVYTVTIGIVAFLMLLYSIWKSIDFAHIFLTYFLVTPFFLIVNGVLTGSFIKEPVVWYNNVENFGVRIGTIPVEDFLYSFVLISLNILLMNGLQQLSKKQTT